MMSTPVSAPARAPFIQQQLSPTASEQEFTYDSDAEREGRQHNSDSQPPPYDADTELVEYTAMSAKLRAVAGDADTSGCTARGRCPPRSQCVMFGTETRCHALQQCRTGDDGEHGGRRTDSPLL